MLKLLAQSEKIVGSDKTKDILNANGGIHGRALYALDIEGKRLKLTVKEIYSQEK